MRPPEIANRQGNGDAPGRLIVFVTGMHRSGTSAFTGSLAFLGVALPAQMLAANSFNPKGYFEPEAVVAANDQLLAKMQRHWNDCRPLTQPEGATRQAAKDHFALLLRTAFAPGSIVALKDPRVSLLLPVWIDAARLIGARSRFVVMLRDPIESAASIIRRDGMDEEAAIAVWLRYMFDAELHSRGHPRTIVRAEAFLRNPVATLERVGVDLGLNWPTAPEAARNELTGFLDAGLLNAGQDMTIPLADLAKELNSALASLAGESGADDTAAYARIDTLRTDFDAMSAEIHGRMVFDQLGKAVTRNWQIESVQKTCDATQVELAAQTLQINSLQTDLGQANSNLAHARRRPSKTLRDFFLFKALSCLSRASPPLPARMAQRLGRSAAKRDPNRSLVGRHVATERDKLSTPR